MVTIEGKPADPPPLGDGRAEQQPDPASEYATVVVGRKIAANDQSGESIDLGSLVDELAKLAAELHFGGHLPKP